MAYTSQVGQRRFYGFRGNLHMHTTLSDGTKTHAEIGRIASDAGLDFIVITDHNVYEPGLDAWMGKTLMLVGEEVHDPNRDLQSSHVLCFDIRSDVAGEAADPQHLIDTVRAQGGFAYLAHPFERDAPAFLPEPNISWRDWEVEGYAGIELWNYMSEFKATFRNRLQAILYAYAPYLAISGPFPETLSKWDELLRTGPVSAIGGSDAHGTSYRLGPLRREVQPYDYLFGCVNTHLLLDEPISGDLDRDRRAVYGALRSGRTFLGYERPGSIAGFAFWARSGQEEATMGESLELVKAVELRMSVPAAADLRILRDGQVIARTRGTDLAVLTPQPGVYRAEAHRRHMGRWRAWIYSNPIYVH